MKGKIRLWSILLSTIVLGAAGCGKEGPELAQKSDHEEARSEAFPISVLTSEFSGDPAGPESEIWKLLEEYTDTRITIHWTPNASYLDKLNISLASGSLPMLLKVDHTRDPAIVSAIQSGAFWELGPYLKDYPNLSQADPAIMRSISTDGKVYGIYRSRPMGRVGISYRKDWLERLGLKEPQTLEQLYEVMKAFTNGDPDGNGVHDTYGMAVSRYALPWDMMQVWFGAPNKWGLTAEGKLVPDHLTKEYKEALRFFRKIYEEKLVNPDFPIYDPTRWNNLLVNGSAGMMLDVADTAGRLETAIGRVNPQAVIDVKGGVQGPYGFRTISTSGYNGVYMISRSGVRTEEELRRVLDFLDQLNDPELQKLLHYGLEGIHYTVQEGRISVMEPEQIPADYKLNDLSQLLMMIPDRVSNLFTPATKLREKVNQVMEENLRYLVENPAEGLKSPTYLERGAVLDHMIKEARIQFIIGRLDEQGLAEVEQNWRRSGGDRIMEEMNVAYKRIHLTVGDH